MMESRTIRRLSLSFALLTAQLYQSPVAGQGMDPSQTVTHDEGQSKAFGDQASIQCRSLKGMTFPSTVIGLPTHGAFLSNASEKHSGSTAYCKVLGFIRPLDPTARDIHFEVNLPDSWNRKAVHFGGAVFDGTLGYSNGLKQPTIGIKRGPTPLQRGYVTFCSDSGHHKRHLFLPDIINLIDSSFGANHEELQNFAQDALKKTHDVAVALTLRRYGQAPVRTFFLGSSSGGHEALVVAQRWPEDYDGVLSGYPPWDGMELVLQFVRTSRALYAKGGFLPPSATRLLASSVLKACDKLDGLEDGLIADVNDCRFNPSTLLCSPNVNTACLTPRQLATVQTFATEQRTTMPLANGVQSLPGYSVLAGADLTGSLGFFHHPEQNPKILLNSSQYTIGSHVIRSFITDDRHFNALTFDPAEGGTYKEGVLKGSLAYDASEADLSRFAAHGGKLLLVHGTADSLIPTNSSVMYYRRVEAAMGDSAVKSFMRFYLIPGFGHGEGEFLAGFDALGVLERWLDEGSPPDDLSVEDKSRRGHGRSRPLCAYPAWPAYNGSGNPRLSASFHCSSSKEAAGSAAVAASAP